MMAEDTTTLTEADGPTEGQRQSDRVPYNRHQDVVQKLNDEKKRSAELEDRLEALEQKDKSDVERLTRELEKVQKKFADAEARAAELESARARDAKANLVAQAAAKHKFHDPALVGRIVDLDEIEDADSAEALVKRLAKESPFLVQSSDDEMRQRLKRVGVDGSTIDDEGREKGLVTPDEQVRMWGEEIKRHLDAAQAGSTSSPI